MNDRTATPRAARLMSGTELIAELPLLMRVRDKARGWNTGGYVSGYRGSPVAQLDRALARRAVAYAAAQIVARPGLNEDLAATAVWGSQQSGLTRTTKVDGIFGLWYGKGPGVDRTMDVFRHANAAGTHPKGGVLAVLGDDHGAVSSTLPHQTEHDMIAAQIPVLAPAGLGDFVRLGLGGWEMSRASGAWVGFKVATEIVESRASVKLDAFADDFVWPEGAGNLGLRPGDSPPMQEARLEQKLAMAQAFARANRFDREEGAMGKVRVGIIASGKAWLDLKEALVLLGIEPATHGIALRKIALVWPLEPEGLRAFATRCDRLVFVEEKRAVIEEQARHLLYNLPGRPEILGKTDIAGQSLFPALGELGPLTVARALVRVLPRKIVAPLPALSSRHVLPPAPSLKREPYFCAGCPHATSTRLPEGSRATTGIGCHMMMIDVPGRMTSTFTQMGGEGVSWLGLAPFSEENHIFVNMGDGTYFHSGLLAIRAAVSAKVNATYKILFNDAVAMTGGQAHDGPLNVPALAAQLLAEGLARVAVVAEEPAHLRGKLPDGVSLDHRDRLTAIQMELREQPGVSALIYDQVCAAEKRRRRKIGTFALPTERVVINEAVCEGCGDCAVQSGCIALEPADTPQGLKRRINQSSCNVDLSCLKGFCPSFVTLPGATLRQASVVAMPDTSGLATPKLPACGLTTFNIVLAGIGGSGVITVAEMLSRAAVLDGLSMAGLDQTGLAQKNGSVVCHLRLATSAERLHASRVPEASADLLLGFDIVVSGGAKVLPLTAHDRTRIVCDSHLSPTAEIVRSGGAAPDAAAQLSRLKQMVAEGAVITSDATRIAYSKLGDTMAANLVLVGHAWQSGLLPLRLSALEAALEQGKSAEFNRAAFAWGRLAAANPGLFDPPPELRPQTLDEVIAAGETHMTAWGGARAARDWRTLVDLARTAETGMGDAFSRAVAATGLRLMAYKDEYEVARLHRLTSFRKELDQTFVLDGRPRFHLAPPFLSWRRDGRTGRPAKIAMGRIADWSFALLVRLRSLRATPFDLFGRTHERQAERRLSRDFAALVTRLSAELSTENHFEAIRIVSLGQHVRGFGPVKAAAMVRYEEQLTQALKNF